MITTDKKGLNTPHDEAMYSTLEQIFGFSSFRPGQREIIDAVLAKRDILAIMPTGGGKSLCYQLPACILPGICVVVSPLIALMKDQVDAAELNGIRAAYINSSQSEEERRNVQMSMRRGELNLVYISPERLAVGSFMDLLKSTPVSFVAIDEAHCICSWGHDFRPDYLQLSRIVSELPAVPIAAFTASATGEMRRDIIRQLGLRDPYGYCGSFNRSNLFYEVEQKNDAERQILNFVNKRKGEPGIIYRMTRESVEGTADLLRSAGINALPYHAGLSDEIRKKNQEKFSRDHVDVVVATIAFGMGIDKSNVRYVVHGDLPRSLEHYYQETGRAGRDGDPAHCLLLFARGDIPRLHYFIDQLEDERIARQHRRALSEMVSFASRHTCRRSSLLAHFGEILADENCGGCDVCTGEHVTVDISKEAQMLLSAVVRTGQRFGMNYIINVLRGADTRQIRDFRHDRLKTWGVGKETSKQEWKEIFGALLAQEICTLSDGKFPVVLLNTAAVDVLKGEKKVSHMRKPDSVPIPDKKPDDTETGELFNLLRKERRRLAEEQGVPPFVVFSDRTLHDMVKHVPLTLPEMLAVNGVGERKLEQYGARFIAVITAYVEVRPGVASSGNVTNVEQHQREDIRSLTPATGIGQTVRETARLAGNGHSITEIARQRNLAVSTVVAHLEKLYTTGHDFSIGQFIDDALCTEIESLFNKKETTRLKPVVEASGGRFGYEEARLVRAWMNRSTPD